MAMANPSHPEPFICFALPNDLPHDQLTTYSMIAIRKLTQYLGYITFPAKIFLPHNTRRERGGEKKMAERGLRVTWASQNMADDPHLAAT